MTLEQGNIILVKTEADPVTVPYILDPAYPTTTVLHAPYPNPFNGRVSIPFSMRTSGEVKVTVYDSFGREVALLQSEFKVSGSHQITWMPESMPSGTYMVKVGLANSASVVPVTLVK